MTREEQATEASEYYYNDIGLRVAFEEGAQWADEHPKCPWISVNDRLPDKINKFMSEPVLCRYTRGSKEYFHVSQYDFEFDEWQISNVTHWMPIPELKKGE